MAYRERFRLARTILGRISSILFALAIVVVLEWNAVRTPEWRATPRGTLPGYAPLAWLALAGGLSMILEEWWRCRRAASVSRNPA